MKWLTMFFTTSIGRKQLMALTGVAMSGFLIAHLSGNLLLYVGGESEFGQQFNKYAEFLESQWWLIPAELGLIAIFLLHVGLAIKLSLESKAARANSYAQKNASDATMASRTMLYSGLILFLFIVIHLVDFKYGTRHPTDGLAGLVRDKLANPVYAIGYTLAMVILNFHLMHGVRSAFQTFGLNHPKYNDLVRKVCLGTAILLSAGFASIPMWFLITQGGQS